MRIVINSSCKQILFLRPQRHESRDLWIMCDVQWPKEEQTGQEASLLLYSGTRLATCTDCEDYVTYFQFYRSLGNTTDVLFKTQFDRVKGRSRNGQQCLIRGVEMMRLFRDARIYVFMLTIVQYILTAYTHRHHLLTIIRFFFTALGFYKKNTPAKKHV